MKRLIIGLLGITFTASAAEYGWLRSNDREQLTRRNNTSTSTSDINSKFKNFVLNEGDSLTFVSLDGPANNESISYIYISDNIDLSSEYFYFSPNTVTGLRSRVYITDSDWAYHPEETRTIFGPLEILGIMADDDDIQYKINRSTDSDGTEKFSVSLDNDGDRVAVGYKENGTNSVVKVYQFDGSSWNQLGEDIE